MKAKYLSTLALFLFTTWLATFASADPAEELKKQLLPILDTLRADSPTFEVTGTVAFQADNKSQRVDIQLRRYNSESFQLELTHPDYAIIIHRNADQTYLLLPKHKTAFVSSGKISSDENLNLDGIINRLISAQSSIALAKPILQTLDPDAILFTLTSLTKVTQGQTDDSWRVDNVDLKISGKEGKLSASGNDFTADLKVAALSQTEPQSFSVAPEFQTTQLDREQLERHLVRAIRRAGEILAPGNALTEPSEKNRQSENGELRWIDHQRVVILKGSPEEIGAAHGKLLKNECLRCIDSVYYTFGLAQTIQSGKWFPHELRAAYQKLAPFIPERHKIETRALAASLGLESDLVETVNVFPELFHCSGFAVFNSATKDGTLYHGRVLDYMTAIGLQDAATTFIISADGQIPFANVGYAGFIGSVSGMNSKQISLGEMGGRGEGQWDGVPMATLMRRALEECDSLDEVMSLWKDNPRTCEYYYVFADGKIPSAVGVAATPEKIEFVKPGQGHELLGDGIQDSVVLSAGSRLETLKQRVKDGHGKFDEEKAMRLMDRPVAMESNLHNVLFVPQKGIMYVANADHREPAANRPYVKIDLLKLLAEPGAAPKVSAATPAKTSPDPVVALAAKPTYGSQFTARDTLAPGKEISSDAQECLQGLAWQPGTFTVTCQEPWKDNGDALVCFSSPLANGHPLNDGVTMEWYQAKDKQGNVIKAPAVVVVHESGSGMVVGRLIAQQLQQRDLHTFLIHLPYYGARRGEGTRPGGKELFSTIRQAIADVRRARDAVAAIPAVDASNISLQGTSLGGFVSATSGALDSGYQAVFIMLAGGDLYGVIKNGERDAENLRRELEKNNVTDEQLKSLLNTIEPLRLAHRLNPDRTWVYSGSFDNVVPPRNSKLLVEAAKLSKEHHVEMLADHYSGIVYLPFILNHMSNRVRELKLPTP